MRLLPIALYKKEKTGFDKLGNPQYETIPLKTGEGRKSIWTAQEVALDSRIVSKHLQKIITTISRDDLQDATRLTLNNEDFSVEEIEGEDDDRWRIVSVTSFRK